jgi:Kef-type K+ transport system membrane component KefB/mannitol/fructose-specific phosphotransferase system IIA component
MVRLSPDDIVLMFLSIGTLLLVARTLGELARRIYQPAVVGEILAGVLVGPTVLGGIAPQIESFLFPVQGHLPIVLDGITNMAIALFLLVAGMEVDLSAVRRQGRAALIVSYAGLAVPLVLGFTAAWTIPSLVGGTEAPGSLVFSLFFATALSISALPVIARTLMDLDLYRTDLGMLIVPAAIIQDLIGWIIFAMLLGMLGVTAGGEQSVWRTIVLALVFTLFMLTVGRRVIHSWLPWLQARTSWPGGVLAFAFILALYGAAFTEWIGIHAVFGAFIVGVTIGDSSHLREQTRSTLERFVSFIFAPLFFASIGLRVNFAQNFDPLLTFVVLAIAVIGKVSGAGMGARWAGLKPREAWSVGIALNARGAMEIILGLVALQYGIITEKLFVALVIMAVVTSMMSAPIIQWLLRRKRARRFIEFLPVKSFVRVLHARSRDDAIAELVNALRPSLRIAPELVISETIAREQLMSTGLEYGLAVPHARIAGIKAPLVSVGISSEGVDFDAPDGAGSTLIFLILTPEEDIGAQLEIVSDIARTFRKERIREKALRCKSYYEFVALVKSGQ